MSEYRGPGKGDDFLPLLLQMQASNTPGKNGQIKLNERFTIKMQMAILETQFRMEMKTTNDKMNVQVFFVATAVKFVAPSFRANVNEGLTNGRSKCMQRNSWHQETHRHISFYCIQDQKRLLNVKPLNCTPAKIPICAKRSLEGSEPLRYSVSSHFRNTGRHIPDHCLSN